MTTESKVLIETMVARWTDPNARPLFKGNLIDGDGCCCAQGDVLRVCGMSDDELRNIEQDVADRRVAKELGISVVHSILLRLQNDRVDGCPQDVLTHPERVLGDQAPRVLAFWHRLDAMTSAEWKAAEVAAEDAAWAAAEDAARVAATPYGSAWVAARVAARAAKHDGSLLKRLAWAARAARAAAWATNEIQGASRLDKFYFLPMFGISDPRELDEAIGMGKNPTGMPSEESDESGE